MLSSCSYLDFLASGGDKSRRTPLPERYVLDAYPHGSDARSSTACAAQAETDVNIPPGMSHCSIAALLQRNSGAQGVAFSKRTRWSAIDSPALGEPLRQSLQLLFADEVSRLRQSPASAFSLGQYDLAD